MTGTFTIRPWRPADTEELGEVFRRSVREVASRDYRPAQIEAWVLAPGEITVWAERMQNRTTFVAEENGRLIGFIQYEPPDTSSVWPPWARMVAVSTRAPGFRRTRSA